MDIKKTSKYYFEILNETFNSFISDKGLKLSAALAYYTIFSLAPMMIVLISIGGIFYGQDALQGKVFSQINDLIGSEAALQIQEVLKKLALSGKSTFAAVMGVVTLIIGASRFYKHDLESKSSPKKRLA
jgi:membrane protein